MTSDTIRADFSGHDGAKLAARLDMPTGRTVRAYALFAHCFTCSKDVLAARRIAAELARLGIAVLRFDFTGLGSSKGEFASTNFSSNIADLVLAADWLRDNYSAPQLLIGHSLGGAAVLAAAERMPEVKAIVTIGAPADTEHVLHNFEADLSRIESDGVADVSLQGRPFRIQKQFLDDVRATKLKDHVANLDRALLIMHSPVDATVGIENATEIFVAARHPKSFVSLDRADHLLTKERDALFAARVIRSWVARYLDTAPEVEPEMDGVTRVAETGNGKFQQVVTVGRHTWFADEPESYGGDDTGPSPYDMLAAALGACTTMTLRMYADRKKWDLGNLSVEVSHAKVHGKDCAECDEKQASRSRIDRFERRIHVDGTVDQSEHEKLLEIADKCPVHRTMEHGSVVTTVLRKD